MYIFKARKLSPTLPRNTNSLINLNVFQCMNQKLSSLLFGGQICRGQKDLPALPKNIVFKIRAPSTRDIYFHDCCKKISPKDKLDNEDPFVIMWLLTVPRISQTTFYSCCSAVHEDMTHLKLTIAICTYTYSYTYTQHIHVHNLPLPSNTIFSQH